MHCNIYIAVFFLVFIDCFLAVFRLNYIITASF